eukprot:gene19965-25934_t
MFDVATDCEINSNYINYATFNKIIPLVAIATNDSNIYLYDPNTGDKSHQLCGHKSEVITIDWSPSSPHQLCSGSIDGSIKFWDIRKGNHHGLLLSLDWRQDHTFNHSSNGSSIKQDSNSLRHIRKINWSNDEAAKAHEEAVRNIKYTSCGSYIISSGNDKKIRLWEVSTGKLMPTNYSIGRKSDSMQGKYGNISIIPVHTNHGEPIHTLTGHVGRVTSMTYRKKYQQVISCGKDGMIHLWECNKTPNIKASTNSLHLNKVINSEDYDNWSDYEAEYDNCNTTSKKSNKSKGISAEVVPKQKLIDEITAKHGMIAIPPLPTPLTNIEINDAITKILTDKGDPELLLEYLSNIILKRGWIDKLDDRKNNIMWAICQAAIVRANTPERDSDKVLPLLDAIIKAGSKAEQRFSHLGNKTPLQMFCLAGAFECVKLCIQNGATVYTLDDDHWSPLIVACAPNGPYSDNNSNIVKYNIKVKLTSVVTWDSHRLSGLRSARMAKALM